MRLIGVVSSLACALALAGCGVDPDAVPPGEEPPSVVEDEPAVLDLQASGIIVPPQGGFEQLEVPFGSSRIGTEATLENVLGEPVDSRSVTGDCWLAQVQYAGLTVNFDGAGEFVGYYATAPFVWELTRAEMLDDPQVVLIEDSTLGEEFTIGPPQGAAIAGLFAGEEDGAEVEALWAGDNCIMR